MYWDCDWRLFRAAQPNDSREEADWILSVLLCGRYRAALDAALATEQVEVVANLLEELAARSGLSAALGAAPFLSPDAT